MCMEVYTNVHRFYLDQNALKTLLIALHNVIDRLSVVVL